MRIWTGACVGVGGEVLRRSCFVVSATSSIPGVSGFVTSGCRGAGHEYTEEVDRTLPRVESLLFFLPFRRNRSQEPLERPIVSDLPSQGYQSPLLVNEEENDELVTNHPGNKRQ
ncbi:hypothetical protein BS47DRAFT_1151156 [Hydnum rufescens UP504]|uniref:Uncharacterized protein n=1 Tax=Hydnum rufescens UP504 TaxID=1448309 RepID=A0A9P6B9P2_9AGAM|nr:hypothetical protein BS47DRAFT_1151156 [Hydnum rufescens UP504]